MSALAFYNRITVSHSELFRRTKRSWKLLGYKTKELDEVLTALDAYEDDPSQAAFVKLQTAMFTWKEEHPNEYANRDRMSGGLCRRLFIELGNNSLRSTPTKAVILRGAERASPITRQIPDTEVLGMSIVEFVRKPERIEGELGVIIIDIQNKDLFATEYDGMTGLEHVLATLDTAKEAHLPIIEVWSGQNASAKSATIQEIKDIIGGYGQLTTVRKVSNNAFERPIGKHGDDGEGASEMAQVLEDSGCGNFVVMGYNANQCVAAFLFGGLGAPTREGGNRYKAGILDRGYDVITSRTILASDGQELRTEEGWPYIG